MFDQEGRRKYAKKHGKSKPGDKVLDVGH